MGLFGSATPVSKLVGEGLPVFTVSLLRVILGALALLPFIAKDFRRSLADMNGQAWREVSLIALFGMVGFTFLLGETFEWIHLPGIVLVLISIGLMSRVHASEHGAHDY